MKFSQVLIFAPALLVSAQVIDDISSALDEASSVASVATGGVGDAANVRAPF